MDFDVSSVILLCWDDNTIKLSEFPISCTSAQKPGKSQPTVNEFVGREVDHNSSLHGHLFSTTCHFLFIFFDDDE